MNTYEKVFTLIQPLLKFWSWVSRYPLDPFINAHDFSLVNKFRLQLINNKLVDN